MHDYASRARAAFLLSVVLGATPTFAVNFYPIVNATASTEATDLWPVSNLIQGPGDGFDIAEPHDSTGGGPNGAWVTADDAGFPADYIEEVGMPVLVFDLGEDVPLTEISVWGYSAGNANGVSEMSLQFATASDGLGGFGTSIAFNPTFPVELDPVPRQSLSFGETVTARYVELTATDNYFVAPGDGSTDGSLAGGDRVGLSEVAFQIASNLFVDVDRDTGGVVISNSSESPVSFSVNGYDLTSAAGALSTSGWLSISDNGDANSGGSVDPNNNWTVVSSTPDNLAESTLGTLTVAPGDSIDLGAAWVQSPFEDLQFEFLLGSGDVELAEVRFSGNGDAPFATGDLNFDGVVDEADWPIYRAGYRADLPTDSLALAYQMGDLNGDGVNDVGDFGVFKAAFDAANGVGAFEAMLAGVPEPSALLLVACAAALPMLGRRRVTNVAVLALASVLFIGAEASAQLPTLVAHWPLDGDSTDAVGTNDGFDFFVEYGEPGANGATGTAAFFNGFDAGIDVDWAPELNPESFTVTAWARTDLAGGGFNSVITSRNDEAALDPSGTYGYILYDNSGDSWSFWTGPGVDAAWDQVTSPDAVPTGVWQHVALSYDAASGVKSLYVDGDLVASGGGFNYSPNLIAALHIGSGSDFGDAFFFEGAIDDVGLFDQALTVSEIQNVASNGVAAFTPIRLKLAVDTASGLATIVNDSGVPIEIDQYEILSNGDLNADGWSSLQDQDFEGNGPATDSGDGWEVLGTPNSNFLGEGFLQGSSSIDSNVFLGAAFTPGSSPDPVFSYRTSDGGVFTGIVELVDIALPDGDFNADGVVDAADYTVWRDGLGTTYTAEDYDTWVDNFGAVAGPAAGVAVPEPTALSIVLLSFAGLTTRRVRFVS